MLDFSVGKLAIIFVLCLIVLGPEKLPKLAAQLGRWTGQARAMARHFRTQLEQEIAAEEFAKQKREVEEAVRSSMDAAASPLTSIKEAVDETVEEAKQALTLPEIDPSFANGSGHVDYDALTSDSTSHPASDQASGPTSGPNVPSIPPNEAAKTQA